MSVVNLVSGGIDSALISLMVKEEEMPLYPLFIDYGQRAVDNEWKACVEMHGKYGLPNPTRMNLPGYGAVIISGLTSDKKDVKDDAFTPGRNLLFLLAASAYAVQENVNAVAIGLLAEEYSLFPDQRKEFLQSTEKTIELAMGRRIKVMAPLFEFSKAEVLKLAEKYNLSGTYSCHLGTEKPCGSCISCQEINKTEV